ncbi:MAG TPA: hypothetical protein VF407_03165 [Polyangiaceae bacterium]
MASARRLWLAIAPTPFDPNVLRRAIETDRDSLASAFEGEPEGEWEREVFAASVLEGDAQAAAMNEALSEIDFRLARWGRVPRVCASIASSTGFLCGAMALRAGLADVDMVNDAAIDATLHGAVAHALGVAAFGLAGAVACVALDSEARKALKSRRLGADLLVERLERHEDREGTEGVETE